MDRRHVAPHGWPLLLALHLLLRRRALVQTAGKTDLRVVFVAPVAAMLSLCRILSHYGLLPRHLGQVTTAAVVARQDDSRVLVVARGVSEGLLGLGLGAGR